MINPGLYEVVRHIFGNVIVEHEDEYPRLIPVRHVNETGRPWTFADNYRGETYRVACPICGDRKHHLYISAVSFTSPVVNGKEMPATGLIAHCFRRDCMRSPENREKVAELLQMPANSKLTLQVQQDTDFDDSESSSEVSCGLSVEDFKTWQPDYHPLYEGTPIEVQDYVVKRGITEDDARRLYIGWGKCWNARKESFIGNDNWLQFPIFDQTGLRGFQSRSLKSNDKMKYFFDYRTPKKLCLYNRLEASRHNIVGICEGVIDSIHIGKTGMAFFGYEPSTAQKRLIQQDGAKMVLYFPDQKMSPGLNPVEVADNVIAQWKQSFKFPWGIYRIDVPGEDAGALSYDDIWLAAYEQLVNYHVPSIILKQVERQIIENRR